MANAKRGEVVLTVGGEELVLRLSINALCEAETLLGMATPQIAAAFGAPSVLPLNVARGVLWAGLREKQPGMTLEAAGELLGTLGLNVVVTALGEALVLAFPQQAGASADPS